MLASHNLQILNGQKQGWCEALRQPTMYTLRDIGETGGRVLKQNNLFQYSYIPPHVCQTIPLHQTFCFVFQHSHWHCIMIFIFLPGAELLPCRVLRKRNCRRMNHHQSPAFLERFTITIIITITVVITITIIRVGEPDYPSTTTITGAMPSVTQSRLGC